MSDRENIEVFLNMLEERELEGRKKQQAQKKQQAADHKGVTDWFKGLFRKSK
jgi:hypothetical protein